MAFTGVTGTAVVRFHTPMPTMIATGIWNSMRVVVGGAGKGAPGNQVLMDPSRSAVYGEAGLVNAAPFGFPTNGVVVTRVPYTFPDAATLATAPQRTKEELARFVEKGWIDVIIGGVTLTALQVRTMTVT